MISVLHFFKKQTIVTLELDDPCLLARFIKSLGELKV
ncbi:MAG: hypothetical protein ACI9DO_003251 [Reinekea sp.]|jgi:hypothetical protein